jgi:hypothetical protein
VGANPVVCAAPDQCHEAGVCNPETGVCSAPPAADGIACDDDDLCTADDACVSGTCRGTSLPDSDDDGVCDARDACPDVSDPTQEDTDGDGVGDACQCSAPAPGRCLTGGGSSRTDCLMEFNTGGPVLPNRDGSGVLGILRCTDGEAACDRDGMVNGQCTFGVAVCLGNADPRLAACRPADVVGFEVLRPNPLRSRSSIDRTNALGLEEAVASLGPAIRRRGREVTPASAATGRNRCTASIELVTPAPAVQGARPVRRDVRVIALAADGRRDRDRVILECHR